MTALAATQALPRSRAIVRANDNVRVAQHRLMVLLLLFALMTAVIGARLMRLAVVNAPHRTPPAAVFIVPPETVPLSK